MRSSANQKISRVAALIAIYEAILIGSVEVREEVEIYVELRYQFRLSQLTIFLVAKIFRHRQYKFAEQF